jgi:DNA-binding XRE family transcriptional regulator
MHNTQCIEKIDIGKKLKQYRMRKLWTLRQMATVTDLSEATIYKIEVGDVTPHDLTVAKILKAIPDLESLTA